MIFEDLKMKKISEVITLKTINRPYRDSKGEQAYEELEFELPYNPNLPDKDIFIRVFARVTDLILYGILAFMIDIILMVSFKNLKFDLLDCFAEALIISLILNPFLEHKTGKTLGKLIFKIQVIDEYCHHPSLLISYKRNFLSLANVVLMFRMLPAHSGMKHNQHNEMCNTYTVYDKDITQIVNLINS